MFLLYECVILCYDRVINKEKKMSEDLTPEEKEFYTKKCRDEKLSSVTTRIGLWGPWMDQLNNLWSDRTYVPPTSYTTITTEPN